MTTTRGRVRTPQACAKRTTRVRRFCRKRFGGAMCLRIAFLTTDFICFFLFIRWFSAGGLRLSFRRDEELLPDLQFAWVVNVIERNQIAVRDFEFLGDSDWIIALFHNVSLS